jgi:hypothetical protein
MYTNPCARQVCLERINHMFKTARPYEECMITKRISYMALTVGKTLQVQEEL